MANSFFKKERGQERGGRPPVNASVDCFKKRIETQRETGGQQLINALVDSFLTKGRGQ